VYINSGGRLKRERILRNEECLCGCVEKLSNEEKRAIFDGFNNLGNHQTQNTYLRGCVQLTGAINGRRKFRYQIQCQNRVIALCKKVFLSIHGIPASRLRKKATTRYNNKLLFRIAIIIIFAFNRFKIQQYLFLTKEGARKTTES